MQAFNSKKQQEADNVVLEDARVAKHFTLGGSSTIGEGKQEKKEQDLEEHRRQAQIKLCLQTELTQRMEWGGEKEL